MAGAYTIFDLGLDLVMNKPFSLVSFQSENPTEVVGAMAMVIPGSVSASNISAGEIPQILFYAKQTFSDTTNGMRQGFDPTDGLYKWIIGDATSSIDWNVTTANTLTVIGSITTSSGTIGGFSIGSDFIRDAADSFGMASTVTGGDDVRFWAGDTFANRSTAPYRVTEAGVLTARSGTIGGWTLGATTLTGGVIIIDSAGNVRNSKTSFTDTAAGFYIGTEGLYVGSALDASVLKYTISSGVFDFIGTVSSRSTATIAATINSSGNVITDLINARLDSSAKTILADFDFGSTNYAGAVKSGDITWNTTTGAITGGSGIVVYRSGIVGAAAGVATFTIDGTTGAATFAGALSAPTGNIGGFTIGATSLSVVSGGNTTTVSSGATAFSSGPTGSPTFSVTLAGAVTATNGTIGGFSIGSDYIRDAADSMGMASTVTGGDDVRFWAGATFANRATAPFRVTEAGAVTASSLTVASGSTIGSTAVLTVESNANNAWTQIGETVLEGAATSISVTGLTARKDLRIVIFIPSSSAGVELLLRFNNDSANNYAYAISANGGAVSTGTTQSAIYLSTGSSTRNPLIFIVNIINLTSYQKVVTGTGYESAGGTNAGNTYEISGHWNNTTDQITRIDLLSNTVNTFATDSKITVEAKKD